MHCAEYYLLLTFCFDTYDANLSVGQLSAESMQLFLSFGHYWAHSMGP